MLQFEKVLTIAQCDQVPLVIIFFKFTESEQKVGYVCSLIRLRKKMSADWPPNPTQDSPSPIAVARHRANPPGSRRPPLRSLSQSL